MFIRIIRDALYEIKYAWQRIFRKYDDRMVFNFCTEFPPVAVEIFSKFRENTIGTPIGVNEIEWTEILLKIQNGFQASIDIDNNTDLTLGKIDEYLAIQQEGLTLFAQYFNDL